MGGPVSGAGPRRLLRAASICSGVICCTRRYSASSAHGPPVIGLRVSCQGSAVLLDHSNVASPAAAPASSAPAPTPSVVSSPPPAPGPTPTGGSTGTGSTGVTGGSTAGGGRLPTGPSGVSMGPLGGSTGPN